MKKLFIYGLPRSGTWFLEKLICQNFNYHRRFNIHKHSFIPEKTDFNLIIYKNPYKWIESCIFRLDVNKSTSNFFSLFSNTDRYNIEESLKKSTTSDILKKILIKKMKEIESRGDKGFLMKTTEFNEQFIETIDPKSKRKIFINPYNTALYWKKHFNTFSQIENKILIYYEDLLIKENRFELLDNIREKFDILPRNNKWNIREKFDTLPRNKKWNIEVDEVTYSRSFNEEEMIPYYLETGNFKYLKSENLPLINLGLGNNWLEENTIYKTINHL